MCVCVCVCVLKKIEKYDDLRTWLAEEDRESMDRFGGQLLANISAKARECVEFVREAKRHITDRRQFSSSLQQQAPANCSRNNSSGSSSNGNNNNLMEPIEKALLFKVWSLLHKDTKEDKDKEEEEDGEERAEPTSSGGGGDGDGELIAQVRQEIVRTILKNCSKRSLFERARCLAGGILYEHYYCVSAPAHSHRNRIAIDE